MAAIQVVVLVVVSVQLGLVSTTSNDAGPVGEFERPGLSECEPTDVDYIKPGFGNVIDVNIEMDENGEKYMYGDIYLVEDYEGSNPMRWNVDRFSGSEYKVNYYQYERSNADFISHVMPKFFKDLADIMVPKLDYDPVTYDIRKGNYTFTNFRPSASDVVLPTVMYSYYRSSVTLFKDNKVFAQFCMDGTAVK